MTLRSVLHAGAGDRQYHKSSGAVLQERRCRISARVRRTAGQSKSDDLPFRERYPSTPGCVIACASLGIDNCRNSSTVKKAEALGYRRGDRALTRWERTTLAINSLEVDEAWRRCGQLARRTRSVCTSPASTFGESRRPSRRPQM